MYSRTTYYSGGITDAEGILLSGILPTGLEVGVRYGQV